MRAFGAAIALAACGSHVRQPPPLGKALAAALVAADGARAPWRCSALDLPALPDETVSGWKASGQALERRSREDQDDKRERPALERTAPGEATIGVVADAAGSAPATIAALGRLRARLDAAHPALVIALGGMGATEAELAATLGTLADHAEYPIVALPGDLEPMPAQLAAIAALRRRGDPVVDGRLVRWIRLPDVTIATLPGAGAAERLAAGGDGCAWRAEDVTAVLAALSARPGMRIAASAEAPRIVEAGVPTGQLELTATVPIDIALHGASGVSAARSGRRDGNAVALSPGSADATTRVPRTAAPTAGLLVVRAGAWSWTPLVDTR